MAVVDQQEFRTDGGQPGTDQAQAQTAEEVRRAAELRLARSVEEIAELYIREIDKGIGTTRVRALTKRK